LLLRIVLPGFPLHLIQRGNNRRGCFMGDNLYRVYLDWLKQKNRGLSPIWPVVCPLYVLVAVLLRRRANRYTQAELEEHLRDFPWSAA
jgi:hypothetical protein